MENMFIVHVLVTAAMTPIFLLWAIGFVWSGLFVEMPLLFLLGSTVVFGIPALTFYFARATGAPWSLLILATCICPFLGGVIYIVGGQQ